MASSPRTDDVLERFRAKLAEMADEAAEEYRSGFCTSDEARLAAGELDGLTAALRALERFQADEAIAAANADQQHPFGYCARCGDPKGSHDGDLCGGCERGDEQRECRGHPAGPYDPPGQTVYCDGSCRAVEVRR